MAISARAAVKYYLLKVAVSAIVVVAISELGRRSAVFGAILASLPLTSLLAFSLLYHETGDTERIAAMSQGIFWLVLPSLVLFQLLPYLLRHGLSFWPAVTLACAITAGVYLATCKILQAYGLI